MDSGWAQFRVIYSYQPRDERDIAIREGDIMVVAKPVSDPTGWLTGENTRTKEVGEFPATYVEYIGDVEELPQEEKPPTPPPRPPRPARRNAGGNNSTRTDSNDQTGDHSLTETSALKPVWCCQCEDFIWGAGSQLYRCAICDLAWHPQCAVELSKFPCKILKKDSEEAEEDYIRFVANPDEWDVNDVLVWLAATNHFLYAEVFRENEITGTKLRHLTDTSLNQMNISDNFHKQSILLAIQELFTGESETKISEVFSGFQSAQRGTKGNHLPKEQNFTSLHWCDKCGKCLWGLFKQGVLCSECGFQCHKKCMFDSVVVCPRRRVRIRRENDADGAKDVNMDDEEWRNPHCVATVLKMYLNELPVCVFTEEKYLSFIKIFRDENRDALGKLFMDLIESLPPENKSLLMYLLRHLYKVSQSVEWNDMSSRKLSSLFAPILLRPNPQHITAMVANHDTAVSIIDFLISNGEWTKENTPPVPPRPPRPSSLTTPTHSSEEKLQDCPWYWGHTDRETVSERLKDQEDGTFIVRDSRRAPGEYTLTLRKGGMNKLIRILFKDGFYGFSEPLTFSSVVELINYYKTRSLASYNPKLDIKLETPLQKYEDEDDEGSLKDNNIYIQKLRRAHEEYMEKSDNYEKIHNECVELEQKITDYHEELDAQREIMKMIEDQMVLHESYHKEAPPQNRAILRQNFDLLKHKKLEARGIVITLEKELTNITEKTRVLNKRMNGIKPDIIKLQRSKQQYYFVLTTEWKMDVERLKLAIGEEGSERSGLANGNPEEDIYDMPQVDISEEQWLHGTLTREEAESLLIDKEEGTFLVRESARRRGEYAVGLKHGGEVKHIAVNRGPGGYGFANYTNYPTLKDLVEYYHVNTLQIHNPGLDTTLKFPLKSAPLNNS
ncbi:hypothetical protein pdam_00005911 [Pocillopora damicornis]|uniref:Phosphatidylinositol 3-kinase regulatory subunit alpha n=1 Tax=Pocillopora damicornis TaxID=46731 RepID=A0A3M6TBB2_POCDA|nr:hypothetical protein pdam_00005911 [Pocillopora damicornis]